jgi:hypothetical protein
VVRSRTTGGGRPPFNALSPEPAKNPDAQELARLRAENKKLAAELGKTKDALGKTKTALSIAGKAFVLLEETSESADSTQRRPSNRRGLPQSSKVI